MRDCSRKRTLLWEGLLAVCVVVAGCGGDKDSAPKTEYREEIGRASEEEPIQPPPDVAVENEAPPPIPLERGIVLAGKEVGLTIGGDGAGSPERSLDTLEQQVLTLLPEVRAAYEQERMQEPGLMGSLDVSMVIEPNGRVSDLRFPVKRVSSDRLTMAVFDRMRAWVFPPADFPAQLRLTLLFVPPDIDESSILSWEKQLGSRPVIETAPEPQPVVVAAAVAPEKQTGEETRQEKRKVAPPPTETKPKADERRRVAVNETPQKKRKAAAPSEITGWYRVLYPTSLRSAPRTSAGVLAQLRRDTRVQVVNVIDGQWLEVRSVSDRPSGFLWWEDAAPESVEQAGRR